MDPSQTRELLLALAAVLSPALVYVTTRQRNQHDARTKAEELIAAERKRVDEKIAGYIEALEDDRAAQRTETAGLRAELTAVRLESDVNRRRIAELETDLQARDRTIADLKRKVAELTRRLSQYESTAEEAHRD